MLDEFDYKEPACPLSGAREFYYPKKDAPLGRIPVDRVIRKLDEFFSGNDYMSAGRHLIYWKNEAVRLGDKRGELAVENELVGFYRKQGDKDKGIISICRALDLTKELEQGDSASGATVYINCATAFKAFDMSEEAMTLYAIAEEIYKTTLPFDDPRFGALYNNMALTLEALDEFEKAERAYQSALSVMRKAPRGEAEMAITYVNLAHMYEKCNKKEKISLCMDKAYELIKSENLPHNGYYAFVLEKCAPSFGYFGNTAVYKELKKESDEIYAGN